VATARKITTIYYKMVTEKTEFDPEQITKHTEKYLKEKLKQLEKMKERTKSLLLDYHNSDNLVI